MESSESPFDEIIKQVIRAALAGGEHAENTKRLVEDVMKTPAAEAGIHALGEGLIRVLEGKHSHEAVKGLPSEAVEIVESVLRSIGKPTASGS
jgi:hypothetical protein